MLPPGRAAAAIQVLDRVLAGEPAEKALTNWGRAARYAGSGDRAAVRDLVFEALRQRRSAAALGGGETGRGLVLGVLRGRGDAPELWFDGAGFGPAATSDADAGRAPQAAEIHDIPDWLEAPLRRALAADFEAVTEAMRHRAPVVVRVNLARNSRAAAQAALAEQGISAIPHPLAASALELTEGARKLQASQAYTDGLVELQDAASQAVVEALPLADGMKVLDLCAGGGGKTLAMAAQARLKLWAHDAHARRMEDLTRRAARAGVAVSLTANPEAAAPYDLVLTDVPCSGSGSWRRDPEGKWRLTAEKLAEVTGLQAEILERAAKMVGPQGVLAYATCSFLCEENEDQIAAFLTRHPSWRQISAQRFSPLQGGDGFFYAQLRQNP